MLGSKQYLFDKLHTAKLTPSAIVTVAVPPLRFINDVLAQGVRSGIPTTLLSDPPHTCAAKKK